MASIFIITVEKEDMVVGCVPRELFKIFMQDIHGTVRTTECEITGRRNRGEALHVQMPWK